MPTFCVQNIVSEIHSTYIGVRTKLRQMLLRERRGMFAGRMAKGVMVLILLATRSQAEAHVSPPQGPHNKLTLESVQRTENPPKTKQRR